MGNKSYESKVIFSTENLNAVERIKEKNVTDAKPLDAIVTPETALVIAVSRYSVVQIHNEMSDNQDYKVAVLTDDAGERYSTSSESLMKSIDEIVDELKENDVKLEDVKLKIYKRKSKNFQGYFITATVA